MRARRLPGCRHAPAPRACQPGAGPGIGMQEEQPVAPCRRGAGRELRAPAAQRRDHPGAGRPGRGPPCHPCCRHRPPRLTAIRRAQAASVAPSIRAAFRRGDHDGRALFSVDFLTKCSHDVLDRAASARHRSSGTEKEQSHAGRCRLFLPYSRKCRAKAAARLNPAVRFESTAREAFDDGWGSLADLADLPPLPTTLLREKAKSAIAWNDSPDIGFDRSINPYRGCEHGCVYCYARPSHAYVGYSPGLDFETKLLFKPDLPALLEKELRKPGYVPKPVALGANTDPYQPIERTLLLTRQVLEVLERFGHPVTIVTKSAGVLRDLDILGGWRSATWCMCACRSRRWMPGWRGGWSRARRRRCGGCRRSGRWPRRGCRPACWRRR